MYRHVFLAICDTEGVKADRLLAILLLLQTHGRVPAPDLAERLEVSVRTIMRDVAALSAAGVLQEAVFADRRLRLRYRHSNEDRVRSYTLDPYGLVDKAGVWYLVADHRGQPRLFRVDRMVAAAVAAAPVRRRAGVELAAVW